VIAALFVEKDGAYANLEGVDIWDEARDARKYPGSAPVVAHPPCARWCQLAGLVEARWGHKRGEDGGCFASALESVRRWGGVLEHPAYTDAWAAYGLPDPGPEGWYRTMCGGWVCQVYQRQYGHRARKATWLYYVGSGDPPSLRWGRGDPPEAWVSYADADRYPDAERLSPKDRSATPEEFRDFLLDLARGAA
jgi:hypothetical protein